MAIVNAEHMSNMANCHEGSMDKDKTKSTTEHKSCTMGAGCNFSLATPIGLSSKYVLIDLSSIAFPRFDSSEKSVDLSPPLKPPA
jgi:hypothetical protein